MCCSRSPARWGRTCCKWAHRCGARPCRNSWPPGPARGGTEMARIIGGVGSSHAPSIAHAWDKGLQQEAMWAPLFEGYEPAKRWLEQQRPDLMVVFYNDH